MKLLCILPIKISWMCTLYMIYQHIMFCFNQDPDRAHGHRKPAGSTTESKVELVEALFGACLVTLNDIDSVYRISSIREYTHSIKFMCCLAEQTIR